MDIFYTSTLIIFPFVIFPLYIGKMEIKIRDKGRVILPIKVRKALGLREKDTALVEIEGNKIILKPKNQMSVKGTKGIVKHKVKLEELEEALGRDEVH